MKKIICLFLMATTLTLASASATTHFEPSHAGVIALSSHEMGNIQGGAKNTLACIAGFLALGAAMATLATATGFIGPMVVFTLSSSAAFAVIGDNCNN